MGRKGGRRLACFILFYFIFVAKFPAYVCSLRPLPSLVSPHTSRSKETQTALFFPRTHARPPGGWSKQAGLLAYSSFRCTSPVPQWDLVFATSSNFFFSFFFCARKIWPPRAGAACETVSGHGPRAQPPTACRRRRVTRTVDLTAGRQAATHGTQLSDARVCLAHGRCACALWVGLAGQEIGRRCRVLGVGSDIRDRGHRSLVVRGGSKAPRLVALASAGLDRWIFGRPPAGNETRTRAVGRGGARHADAVARVQGRSRRFRALSLVAVLAVPGLLSPCRPAQLAFWSVSYQLRASQLLPSDVHSCSFQEKQRDQCPGILIGDCSERMYVPPALSRAWSLQRRRTYKDLGMDFTPYDIYHTTN